MKLTLRPNLRSQCPFEGSNFFFRSTAHAAQCTDRRTALFPAAVSSHEPPHSVRSSPSRHRYDVQACSTLQAEPNASHPTAEALHAASRPAQPGLMHKIGRPLGTRRRFPNGWRNKRKRRRGEEREERLPRGSATFETPARWRRFGDVEDFAVRSRRPARPARARWA